MKIAQVAPLIESVPPTLYGGTERVVSYLTEKLVEQGHDVTLFASGDSVTKARLVSPCSTALRLANCTSPMPHQVLLLEYVLREAELFDVIHFHTDFFHFPFCHRSGVPNVTTLHGRLDIEDLKPLFKYFRSIPVISISDSQTNPLPNANWQATIYHGLPRDVYQLRQQPSNYLAFLGRVSPEKGVARAIEIASQTGLKLKIAAKIDPVDELYYRNHIQPLLKNRPNVEFIGEIGEEQKNDFLGNALALLFPIEWPEPFGLVVIEAMACGTPVIAFRRGSVPEIITQGLNGFIVDTVPEAVQAVKNIRSISRVECRKLFERSFTSDRMANDYVRVYENLQKSWHDKLPKVQPLKHTRKSLSAV